MRLSAGTTARHAAQGTLFEMPPPGPAPRDMLALPMRRPGLLAVSSFVLAATVGTSTGPLVVVARIDTAIHPAAANYLEGVLNTAERDGAALVVVTLSTPGGLLSSTRAMSSTILQSKVPVATFVAPSGAQAASAGSSCCSRATSRRWRRAPTRAPRIRWAERGRTFRRS